MSLVETVTVVFYATRHPHRVTGEECCDGHAEVVHRNDPQPPSMWDTDCNVCGAHVPRMERRFP